jgi:hypothetical protein
MWPHTPGMALLIGVEDSHRSGLNSILVSVGAIKHSRAQPELRCIWAPDFGVAVQCEDGDCDCLALADAAHPSDRSGSRGVNLLKAVVYPAVGVSVRGAQRDHIFVHRDPACEDRQYEGERK